MQELLFLHSAHCPMLVNICMKFHDASLYGLKVIERTRWRQDFVRDTVQREITQTRLMFIKHYAPNRCVCIKVAKSTSAIDHWG